MPALKVECAKSSRSRCTLKECGRFILKGELRIGTGSMMPGASELSYKWRHLCCFTKRQLAAVHSVDDIEGFDDCEEADQALLQRLVKGQLIGDSTLLGRTNVPESPGKKKRTATGKAAREDTDAEEEDDVDANDSDATEDYAPSPAGAAKDKRPLCPYGATCFRKNPDHFKEYRHPSDEPPTPSATKAAGGGGGGTTAAAVAVKPTEEKAKAKPVEETSSHVITIGAAAAAAGKPTCPFGEMCFRTAKEHFNEFLH